MRAIGRQALVIVALDERLEFHAPTRHRTTMAQTRKDGIAQGLGQTPPRRCDDNRRRAGSGLAIVTSARVASGDHRSLSVRANALAMPGSLPCAGDDKAYVGLLARGYVDLLLRRVVGMRQLPRSHVFS